jgi:hypothetical protein
VATDDVIEQRLGEDPEDEHIKERLEREHSELLEELRALIPGAEVLFGFVPSRDRGRARLLRVDRAALVGDRAVPQGPRAARGKET